MHYDSMEPQARAKAAQAAVQFLLEKDDVSLQEASEVLGGTLQGLWDEITADAGLPAWEAPTCVLVVWTLSVPHDVEANPGNSRA